MQKTTLEPNDALVRSYPERLSGLSSHRSVCVGLGQRRWSYEFTSC